MIYKATGRGFTIVELLVVIVVIAILASISVVAYTGIQDRATETVMRSDLKTNYNIVQIYMAEHGVYPPSPGQAVPRNSCTPKGEIGTDGFYCPTISDKNSTVVYTMYGNNFTILYGKGTKAYKMNHTGAYTQQACVAQPGSTYDAYTQPYGYDDLYGCPDGSIYSQ